jgi:hypothetical protein
MKNVLLAAALLLAACSSLWAQSAPAVELDRRYIDPLHGFSIRPPAGAERARDPSTSRLVSWNLREKGNIVWTLAVQQFVETQDKIDLPAYSKALVDKLKSDGRLNVSSCTLTKVADKPAIDLCGTPAKLAFYQRQVWVQAEAGRFLVFQITGPQDMQAKLDDLLTASLVTAQFIDPQAAKAAREKSLAAGAELLKALTDQKMAAALHSQQWFVLQIKGKDAGFILRSDSAGRIQDVDGFQVTVWKYVQVEKDKPFLSKEVLLASANAATERWKMQQQIGAGGAETQSVAEDGMRVDSRIVCSVDYAGKVSSQKRTIPDVPYLPRATGLLLPRLVDLGKPASYAFGTYVTESNDFDMRTFRVIGPEKVSQDGKVVDAIKCADQAAADSEEALLWLTDKGDLIRMEAPEGVVLQAATHEEVLRKFPSADTLLKATERWASQK